MAGEEKKKKNRKKKITVFGGKPDLEFFDKKKPQASDELPSPTHQTIKRKKKPKPKEEFTEFEKKNLTVKPKPGETRNSESYKKRVRKIFGGK